MFKFIALIICIAVVYKAEAQSVIYIDPDNSLDQQQDGSYSHPYDSWTDFAIESNKSYLQKSGTLCEMSGNISITGRTGVVLGSYGTGSKPRILSVAASVHVIDITSSSLCIVRDLDIGSGGMATSGIIIDGAGSSGNLIDQCFVHNAEWGIRIITNGAGNRILNSTIYLIGDDGIFVKDVPDIEIGYCSIYEINQKWFTDRNENYSSGDCIQIASLNSLNFNVHHNQLDHSTTGNKFCLIVAGETYSGTVENNTMTGNSTQVTSCLYFGNTSGSVSVKYNLLQNGNYAVYSYVKDLKMVCNLFSGNNYGIRVMANCNLNALNNSFVGQSGYCISSLSGTSVTAINNVFYLTGGQSRVWQVGGQWSSDYNNFNIQQASFLNSSSSLADWQSATSNDFHSVLGDPRMADAASGNFSLLQDSPCIDKGIDVGLSSDFAGISIPQGAFPDIGAFESQSGRNEIITGSISGYSFCQGSFITVPFVLKGVVNTGNQFIAELSDPFGDFRYPFLIGSVTSTSAGFIEAIIPVNALPGSAYRIRVTASNPLLIGSPNTADLEIIPLPAPPVIRQAGSYLLESSIRLGNQWYVVGLTSDNLIPGALDWQFMPALSGSYYSRITNASGCVSAPSNKIKIIGTGVDEVGFNEIRVYPNPARGFIIIDFPSGFCDPAQAVLTDMFGRIIQQQIIGPENKTINFPDLSNGLFILRIPFGNKVLTYKVINAN